MKNTMDRRGFLKALGAGAATGWMARYGLERAAQAAEAAGGQRQPNIIVILADDLGYADVGVQGCKDIPTPNIDTIAANGVRFTNGYVTCPICSPTRAGLMTGRYQQRFGHEHNPGPEAYAAPNFGMDKSELTFADRLKSLGYVTGMFGKWHLGFKPGLQPPDRGFDEFLGFLSGANNYLPEARRGQAGNPILRGREEIDEPEYLTDAFGREAVAFIEKHKDEPFFVYLPFNAVHSPLQALEKYLKRFESIPNGKRRTFAAMNSAMDDNVGRVLDKVRALNLEDKTLIFFLSDNGGPTPQTTSSNLPLRGYKAQMWEGGIRIPFMVQWKGRLPAGKVYDLPVVSLDILPTAVVAAGGKTSPDWKLDGVDLLPYLTGKDSGKPHETLCWRMGAKHAIRHGDWKLVVEPTESKPGLFNLAEDISEQNDLADQMPEKIKELTDLYNAWDAQMEKPRWVRQDSRGAGAGSPGGPAGVEAGGSPEERFNRMDRDGDGKLTPDELPYPRLFKRMDQNGDGAVTREEAASALADLPQRGPAAGANP